MLQESIQGCSSTAPGGLRRHPICSRYHRPHGCCASQHMPPARSSGCAAPRRYNVVSTSGAVMADHVRNIFKGKVLELNIETVKLPNGQTTDLEIAHHPGGATIVALDADNRVCLLRQFRHAAGG